MNTEEAIQTLRKIAEEVLDDLNCKNRMYKAERYADAFNAAIGALYQKQEREQKMPPVRFRRAKE